MNRKKSKSKFRLTNNLYRKSSSLKKIDNQVSSSVKPILTMEQGSATPHVPDDDLILFGEDFYKEYNKLSKEECEALAMLLCGWKISHRTTVLAIFLNLIGEEAYTMEDCLEILTDKYKYK